MDLKDGGDAEFSLYNGDSLIDKEYLTRSQDFDILVVKALDNILSRNKIDRRLIEEVEITGQTDPGSLSTMILSTFKKGLEVK